MNLNVLISREDIDKKIKELAKQISRDYKNKDIFAITVLEGAKIFSEELRKELKALNASVENTFVKLSSYANSTESAGKIKIVRGLEKGVKGKEVLVIEDIIDTGLTLHFFKDYLFKQGAKSVRICVLTDKPARRKINVKLDYVGFTIPDKFIVGFGIDCKEQHRELPYIAYVE